MFLIRKIINGVYFGLCRLCKYLGVVISHITLKLIISASIDDNTSQRYRPSALQIKIPLNDSYV